MRATIVAAASFAVLTGAGCGSTTSNGHSSGSGGAAASAGMASGGSAAKGGRTGATGGAGTSGEGADGGVGETAGHGGAEPDPIASGGAPSAFGGAKSFGGASSAGSAGSIASAGKGGAPDGCLEGVPCNCGALVGTTQCKGGAAACSCPPAEQCSAASGTPCFEPCGGDPFGSWVMVDSCFKTSNAGVGTACRRLVQASPNGSDLRLRILDGGGFEFRGTERWSVTVSASLSCLLLDSVNECDGSTIGANPFMFSSGGRLSCKSNACGVCDCTGDLEGSHSLVKDSWSREGNVLRIGSERFPYCVKGDELWLGGGLDEDSPVGAYKFKKQSCTGTPVKSCAERGKDECLASLGCKIGSCQPLPFSTVTTCSSYLGQNSCDSSPECQWVYENCSGTVECQFANCDSEPGCSWGPPKQHCGGMPQEYCGELDAKSCLVEHGCWLDTCTSSAAEDCRHLNADECAKAPGCRAADPQASVKCIGNADCARQSDPAICAKLACQTTPFCDGQVDCTSFSLDECHDHPGCRFEW